MSHHIQKHLIDQICKILRKGKEIEQIAEFKMNRFRFEYIKKLLQKAAA